MRNWRKSALCGGAALAGVIAVMAWLGGSLQTQADPPELPREEKLKPQWRVGDAWIIETATRSLPPRIKASKDRPAGRTVVARWKFTVAASEKLNDADCFRIDITVEPNPKNQPVTKLWVDARSLALRQLQTQMPLAGKFVDVTESYDFGKGPPAPVSGPLTALPIDLPVFLGSTRAQKFSYTSVSGPAESKRAVGDVAFAVDITQTLTPVKLDAVRSLVPPDFTRGLEDQPLVEVKLKTPERSVRQIWKAGQPWPVFADNGTTTAKLIKVLPPQPKE